ncbi:MAG: 1-acyl-sn-glycerol-3-phosphate acyltransferase [Myxococcales bacterium]|nr:1-acyl-sn-glycerol-3-phosphate acyltransferase [Myxococcales bacterium]
MRAHQRALVPALRAAFPWVFTGRNYLPAHDSYVVVANHSGLGTVESLVLPELWASEVGTGRRIAAMVHPAMLRTPGLGALLRSVGCVEATLDGARWARAHGSALVLFPGGDHESMRPVWRADEVDFAGRTGWVRLARQSGLTIVPMAITGTHVTAPTLGYSKLLAYLSGARLFGVRRVPLSVAGLAAIAVSLACTRDQPMLARGAKAAVVYAASFAIPWVPSRVGFHVLPPVTPDELQADDRVVYERVTSAISDVLRRELVSAHSAP